MLRPANFGKNCRRDYISCRFSDTLLTEFFMSRLFYSCFSFLLISSAFSLANAQTILTCDSTSVPPIVHQEGIAERIGDIVLNCSGGMPLASVSGNLSIFLSVNVTNRVAGTTVTDIVFTMD